MKFSPARALMAIRWFIRYARAVESHQFTDAIEPRRQLEALGYQVLIVAPVPVEVPVVAPGPGPLAPALDACMDRIGDLIGAAG